VLKSFNKLILARSLTPEGILRIFTLASGALWVRTQDLSTTLLNKKGNGAKKYISELRNAQQRIAAHLVDLFRCLLEIGITEMQDAPTPAASDTLPANKLALKITAVFRRTLPTLHVASSWLLTHLDFLQQDHKASKADAISHSLELFWPLHAKFLKKLSSIFPAEELPVVEATLEEDVDLRGFAPFASEAVKLPGIASIASALHPNEEHLTRIRLILEHAKQTASSSVWVYFIYLFVF
jgi:hypothetical protein